MRNKYEFNWKQYRGGNVAGPIISSSKYFASSGLWSEPEKPRPLSTDWVDIKTNGFDGVMLYKRFANYDEYSKAIHRYLLDYYKEYKSYPILKIVRGSAYNNVGAHNGCFVSFKTVDPYIVTFAYGLIFGEATRVQYAPALDALRVCTPEEEAQARAILEEHEKKKDQLKIDIAGNTVQIKDYFNGTKAKFNFGKAPYCCGMSEVGLFSIDAPDNDVKMMTKAVIDYIAYHKANRIAGCIVANFVHPVGAAVMQSSNWFKAFREAGFEILGKPFENLVHRGNIIVSLYYQHNHMEYKYE